jgi:putative ABC transport system permease protein
MTLNRLPRSLMTVGWRTLLRRPWQSTLMILGITLGVAVVVAVDLANASASRAFDLSTDAVVGRATHQIVAGSQGFDEALYTHLRRQGILNAAAPIVADYVSSPQLGDRPLQLLGVDPFAEPPFRDYLWHSGHAPSDSLTGFFTEPGALLISAAMAEQYAIEQDARITLDVTGRPRSAFVAGLLRAPDDLTRRALDGIVLADIATAQELLDRTGKLDRIDLIVPEDADQLVTRISDLLPQSVRIQPAQARTGAVRQMTNAFRTNLWALSLLALFVGLFLIYNTMTFSVIQRRPLFGTLRCLGVTPHEVFALVVSEAFIVGVAGSVLGLILGIAMGRNAVSMVTRTVNDLYFVLTVRDVGIPALSLLKGGLIGTVATVITASLPAWEAASIPPRAALSRSGLEARTRRAVVWAAVGSAGLLAAGAAALALPTRSLFVSFGGLSIVVVGFALLTPLATNLFMRGAAHLLGRVGGALGRMAPRDVINSLSRTAIAVAALMVAVSVTIGVSLMIDSFRHTIAAWLGHALQGDVYVQAPSFRATQNVSILDPAVVRAVRQWPGVTRAELIRATTVDSPRGPIYLEAGTSTDYGAGLLYRSSQGSSGETWEAVGQGAAIVSEPLANRLDLPSHDGRITLYTDRGPHAFNVAGVYYDYASTEGTVIVSMDTYRRLWDDDAVTGLAVHLSPGTDADSVARELRDALAPVQRLLIRPNQILQQDALEIFDRTFAITGALQMLATIVAFIGVLSALLSLQLDKQLQIGILRAVGLTTHELWQLVLLETGLMGAAAGLLAMPTGYALSLILVYVINQRSFGWTLQMLVGPAPFLQAFAVAVIAALLAGIYPAYRMSRMSTAEALRYE